MSYQPEPAKTLPSTEYSLKSVSWHLKEISQSLKDLAFIARATDLKLGVISDFMVKGSPKAQQRPPSQQSGICNNDIPF